MNSYIKCYHIKPIKTENGIRFMSFTKSGKVLNSCFGHGFKTTYSAFLGTNLYLKRTKNG